MISDIQDQRRAAISEETNNFKTIIMEVITRELKTPLNSILGLNACATEVMGQDSELVTKFLRPMHQCSEFLMELI